jgi:DNA-binding IclR family transcriptional regulator
MWARGNQRNRRAVLSALAAVGHTGMTVHALAVAVELPEQQLQFLLEQLVSTGRVRRRGRAASTLPGPGAPRYHLPRPHPPVPSQRYRP